MERILLRLHEWKPTLPDYHQGTPTLHSPKWRHQYPIASMHGIPFTYIWLIYMVNVGKYNIYPSSWKKKTTSSTVLVDAVTEPKRSSTSFLGESLDCVWAQHQHKCWINQASVGVYRSCKCIMAWPRTFLGPPTYQRTKVIVGGWIALECNLSWAFSVVNLKAIPRGGKKYYKLSESWTCFTCCKSSMARSFSGTIQVLKVYSGKIS